ncbi:DOLPP1 protein [Tothia fuscella]|uniref:Dolichyldiphosphatase n=1 Tax=Tothia fuscella TaxID=1048955 RepID=A0A9P4NW77_9PEZI|nr:DOLPP1 protein [Tothia fuscella]
MDDAPLASLSLTHVNYDASDPYAYFCAWLALVPQALCVVYVTLAWSSREAEIVLMFAGQMSCEAFNWGLKRWIKEERPRQMNGRGYGMPSSHAQFVSFFSIYLTLFLLLRHKPHPTETHTPISFSHRFLLSCAALVSAATVAWSRIYLNYHTPKQVLVGCGAGFSCAVVWFGVTEFMRRSGWLAWGLDLVVVRWFRMRDLVVSEDLVDAGWARWEGRRKKRNIRGSKKSS